MRLLDGAYIAAFFAAALLIAFIADRVDGWRNRRK
jgi:hypothetical protein